MTADLYDLDAMRAARLEAAPPAPSPLKFGGREFTIPPTMPVEYIATISAMAKASKYLENEKLDEATRTQYGLEVTELTIRAGRAVLGGQWDHFASFDPDMDDLSALLSAAQDRWNAAPLAPSSASSGSTGTKRKRTGNATTNVTSLPTSGENTDAPHAGSTSA